MADVLVTSREACRLIGGSMTLLGRLDRQDILKPRLRLPSGRKRLYAVEDIEAYLDSIRTKR